MSDTPDPAEMTNAEIESMFERLKQWENAFETTNPAQAKAELLAVQEKRFTAQKERAQATEIIIDLRRDNNGLVKQLAECHAEIARLKDEFADALAKEGQVDDRSV